VTPVWTLMNYAGYRYGTITDNCLGRLVGLTALITSLDLSLCRQASDVGLHTLAASLTALTSLNLSWCEQVSDNGLWALAGLTALTSLDLSFCRQVSDNGLPHKPHQPQVGK
jgi:hypothetical protein